MIRFDVPGIGGSPPPLVPYHMTTLAPLVGELVAQLGHDRVDVLGFSWGGGLAQQFAVSPAGAVPPAGAGRPPAPDRSWCRGSPHVLARMLHARAGTRDPAAAPAGSPPTSTAAPCATTPSGPPRCCTPRPRTPRRGYYYQLLAGSAGAACRRCGLIRQPTLIVAGDDDPIIPTINAKIMQRGHPDARAHIYPGGHLALLTEAAELAPVTASSWARPDHSSPPGGSDS